jgi:cobalt-zinc-cadmium efflux system membrane fusion protein
VFAVKKSLLIAGFALLAIVCGTSAWFLVPRVLSHWEPVAQDEAEGPAPVVRGYLDLPVKMIEINGIKTAEATLPTRSRTLILRGSLALDPSRLVHVHSRFGGQIVELATREEDDPFNPGSHKRKRPLGFMDDVKKGDVLAVVWSRELGEKKSELIDGLIRLWVDEQILESFQKAYEENAITPRELAEQTRVVEVGRTAVRKARRTLASWFLKPEEIDEVEDEARRIHREGRRRRDDAGPTSDGRDEHSLSQDKHWAEVNIVAEIRGTIVEKNAAQGDIVDTNDELFKINDLSQLLAWVHVYEEDLQYLTSLPKEQRRWKLTLNSNPAAGEMDGFFDRIGDIIDVNEHMALVGGPVPNPDDELIAGQFLTAKVELPPELDVVEIPTRALVEDGEQSVVLVQVEPDGHLFSSRNVLVVRRYQDVVYVRSRLTPDQKKQGLEELRPGERVVSVGALELREVLLHKHEAERHEAEKQDAQKQEAGKQ